MIPNARQEESKLELCSIRKLTRYLLVLTSLVPDVLGHARSLPVTCHLSGRGSKSVFGSVARCALERLVHLIEKGVGPVRAGRRPVVVAN